MEVGEEEDLVALLENLKAHPLPWGSRLPNTHPGSQTPHLDPEHPPWARNGQESVAPKRPTRLPNTPRVAPEHPPRVEGSRRVCRLTTVERPSDIEGTTWERWQTRVRQHVLERCSRIERRPKGELLYPAIDQALVQVLPPRPPSEPADGKESDPARRARLKAERARTAANPVREVCEWLTRLEAGAGQPHVRAKVKYIEASLRDGPDSDVFSVPGFGRPEGELACD